MSLIPFSSSRHRWCCPTGHGCLFEYTCFAHGGKPLIIASFIDSKAPRKIIDQLVIPFAFLEGRAAWYELSQVIYKEQYSLLGSMHFPIGK